MNDFWIWFSSGFQHILDWNGYDHILYVISLCVLFSISDWKRLLVLVTAFTIGHSLTLAASVLNIFQVKQSYIEVLIPLTILITCVINLMYRNKLTQQRNINFKLNYLMALFFGFIHGLGFSYLLRSMLGKEENLIFPLLSFNLGLEFGQLFIVVFMLIISIFIGKFTRVKKQDVVFFVSSAVFGIAFVLFMQRLNEL